MQGNVVRLKEIDDIMLGFLFLGLTALVLGTAMLFGSVSGLIYFNERGMKATSLMVNTMYNGMAFVICGVLSLIMTSMLVFTIRNAVVLKAIEYFSLFAVIATFANVIREFFFKSDLFEIAVALVALSISGIEFFIICNIKKRIEYMLDLQKIRDTLEDVLRNAG
jgi:hypothetical protein